VVRLTGPIRILIFASAIWVISLLSQSILASAFWTHVAATLTVMEQPGYACGPSISFLI